MAFGMVGIEIAKPIEYAYQSVLVRRKSRLRRALTRRRKPNHLANCDERHGSYAHLVDRTGTGRGPGDA